MSAIQSSSWVTATWAFGAWIDYHELKSDWEMVLGTDRLQEVIVYGCWWMIWLSRQSKDVARKTLFRRLPLNAQVWTPAQPHNPELCPKLHPGQNSLRSLCANYSQALLHRSTCGPKSTQMFPQMGCYWLWQRHLQDQYPWWEELQHLAGPHPSPLLYS